MWKLLWTTVYFTYHVQTFNSVIFGEKKTSKTRKTASCWDVLHFLSLLLRTKTQRKAKKTDVYLHYKRIVCNLANFWGKTNACTMLCNNNCIEKQEKMTTTIAWNKFSMKPVKALFFCLFFIDCSGMCFISCFSQWMMYQYSLWPEVDRHKELNCKVFDACEKKKKIRLQVEQHGRLHWWAWWWIKPLTFEGNTETPACCEQADVLTKWCQHTLCSMRYDAKACRTPAKRAC